MLTFNRNLCEIKGKSSCQDEQIIVEGQDELNSSMQKIDVEQQDIVIAFFTSYVIVFTSLEVTSIPFDGYPPPDIVTDIIILHEQFLI